MPDKAPNTDYIVKPTLKGPETTDAGKKFDKNLSATMARNDVDLTEADKIIQEIDNNLEQSQGSIKKKIWDLSKMESLVHSDPKLEAIYQDMEHEAEENQRYGYHWNEAVLNIMFNDYVLNSPKYLQKYKMAIPSEKKRRDKSGIKDLQRKGAQQMNKTAPKPKNVPEGEIHNNSLEGVIEEQYKLMENWAGDMSDEPNRQPVDQSNQNDHLKHRIDRKHDTMNEHHLESREEKEAFIYKNKPSLVMGQIKSLPDEQIDNLYHQIEVEMGLVDDGLPQEPDVDATEDEMGATGLNENGDMIAAKQEKDDAEDINETTSDGGSAGPAGGASRISGFSYEQPFGKVEKKKGIHTSFWPDGEVVGKSEGVEESNYLTDPLLMESIYKTLNEDKDPCWDDYEQVGMKEKDGKEVPNCVPTNEGMDDPNNDSIVPIAEKAKSKNQQEFMGMVRATQKGEMDNPSASVEKAAKEMKPEDVKDFASTKHKGLPTKVKTDEAEIGSDGSLSGMDAAGGDPTKEEMVNFLRQEYGSEYDDFDGEEAIYWFGYEYHGGQNSNLYSALSTSQYKPARSMMNADSLDGTSKEMYEDLVMQFAPSTFGEGLAGKAIGGGIGAIAGMKTGVGAGTGASLGSAAGDAIQDKLTETMANGRESDPTTMASTMKDVPAGGMGSSMGGEGMFEGEEIDEDVSTRTKCKSDEDPVKGKRINEPGGCKKKSTLKVSPEDRQKNPHNIKSRQERIKRQEKDMENTKKNQAIDLEKSKKELAEQIAMFESVLGEDKKPASLVNVERLGKENKKNFDKMTEVPDSPDEISAMEQMEEVPENPYELGEKIEAQKIKDNKMQSFDNEGDSTNDDNKHIPKRNLTSDEEEQVRLMRDGMHSLTYDNKPSERFEERMERDMGEEIYELRQKQMEFKADKKRYNKEDQPVNDSELDDNEFNKYKQGYINQKGIGESVVTGKYRNDFGKNQYVNFKLNEVEKIDKIDESYKAVNMDGLGNRYDTHVQKIDESKWIETNKFYIKEGKVFVVEEKTILKESEEKENKVVNEQFAKFKKLSGYDPSKYVSTKHARNLLK